MNAFPAIKLLPCAPVMRWLCRVLKRRPASRAAPVHAADLSGVEAVADEGARGCGWFDSSHDLLQGLRVQEHASADSLARELPLGAWLDLQLSGWRATAPAAVPPGFTPALTLVFTPAFTPPFTPST